MRENVLKTLLWGILVGLLAFLCFICAESRSHRQSLTCSSIRVEFADSCRFVTEADVRDRLDHLYGAYIGQRVDSVNLTRIENILNETSAVKKAEAYLTKDGVLNIRVSQRLPAILFVRGDGYGFYADDRGYIFPKMGETADDVPVISGAVPINCPEGFKGKPAGGKQEKWMNGILQMTSYMKKHFALDKRIAKMEVRSDGKLVLTSKKGQEEYIFGAPDGFEEKFRKMNIYENTIKDSLTRYKSINLMYRNQIVCK